MSNGNSRVNFPEAALSGRDGDSHRRELATVLNNALHGKLNNTGTVTLTAGAATTLVSDANIGVHSVLILVPTTSDAAAALPGVFQSYPNPNKQQVTLNHAANLAADCTFAYLVFG